MFKNHLLSLMLEMDLKFDRLLMSRSDFLSKNVTKAGLKHDGKQHSRKDIQGYICSRFLLIYLCFAVII